MSQPNRLKLTQINVQAVKRLHRGLSTFVNFHTTAFAFCDVFDMQLSAQSSELLCILA